MILVKEEIQMLMEQNKELIGRNTKIQETDHCQRSRDNSTEKGQSFQQMMMK